MICYVITGDHQRTPIWGSKLGDLFGEILERIFFIFLFEKIPYVLMINIYIKLFDNLLSPL